MENIYDFEDFISEELNFERISDTECYLTRHWYYYNENDDIFYGSDERPYPDSLLVFENNEDLGIRLIEFELATGKHSEINDNEEILKKINELGGGVYGFEETDTIQNLFDKQNESRYMLLDGRRMLASSFDVIEEN